MKVRVRRVAGYAAAALVLLAAAYLVVISPLRSYLDDGGDRATPSATADPATTAPPSTTQGTQGTQGTRETQRAEPTRSPATASGVPMPVGDQPGWRQVVVDDFAGTKLDEDIWFRYEGQPSGDPGGWFDPSHVSVGDGKLVIGGWQEPDRDNLYVTGGVSTHDRHSQTYGRYQVRFRADQGTGIAYVLLLWPTNNKYPPEIDFAEDNGRDRQTVYGVLHPPDQAAYPNEEYTVRADATEWHTAGLEWTPERLVYTLDGKPWATIEGPQVPDEPMDLALQTQAWYCGQGWEACPDETTPDRVNLEVDWVSIHAYQP